MAYDNQTTYNKFNAKDCTCEDKSNCTCGCKSGCPPKEKCGCCPVGLVEVKDKDGNNIGCLSPNDAQEYMTNTFRCPDGYIRLLEPVTFRFLGCLTPTEYAEYVAALA